MNNIFKKTFLVNFLLMIVAIASSFLIYNYNYVSKDYNKIDLEKTKKLMIVAHPDDETLWGGSHLLEDDYLVVCITCRQNRTRIKEFKKVMKKTNDQYIMLGYPDKILGIRSNWKQEENQIYNDIEKIMSLKNWDFIVTHNEEGEYGHIHHIKTNQIVTRVYNDSNIESDLYFFGKYYTKGNLSKLESKPPEINEELYKIKVDSLIEIYKSQSFIKEKFNQMFKYEDWIKYENIIAKE